MQSTPPQQNQGFINDNPPAPKSVSSNRAYQTDELDDARLAVLQDLGETVPQITLKDFMEHVAPRQPDFDLEGTLKTLRKGPKPTLSPQSGRWAAFEKEVPANQTDHEDAVFKPLVTIGKKVVKAIIANSPSKNESTAELTHNPTFTPFSERTNATKPDGYFLLRERSHPDGSAWADIALLCEYKKHSSDADIYDVSRSYFEKWRCAYRSP